MTSTQGTFISSRIRTCCLIMRPSSLGGGRILRRTLPVRPSVPLSSVTSRHLANYNDTHVLFGRRRGLHIVRPSRPHKLVVFNVLIVFMYSHIVRRRWPNYFVKGAIEVPWWWRRRLVTL